MAQVPKRPLANGVTLSRSEWLVFDNYIERIARMNLRLYGSKVAPKKRTSKGKNNGASTGTTE